METLGKRLRNLRQQNELSMAELANKLNVGISAPSISNIENDKQDPNTSTIIAYSNFFNVPTDWILKGGDLIPFDDTNNKRQPFSDDEVEAIKMLLEGYKMAKKIKGEE